MGTDGGGGEEETVVKADAKLEWRADEGTEEGGAKALEEDGART